MYMWTRKHKLTGQELKALEFFVKFCLQMYFKLYFSIKVHHRLMDNPKHMLMQLRILKSQLKNAREAVTLCEGRGLVCTSRMCPLVLGYEPVRMMAGSQ